MSLSIIFISPYKLLNMFRATLCPSSGADDLVVLFHVWCSAVTIGIVIPIYVQYLRVDMFVCFHVRWVVVVWWVIVVGGFRCSV